jgi:hypothetical protein
MPAVAAVVMVHALEGRKQHVVFEMDVVHQVIAELREPGIERAPSRAGVGRRFAGKGLKHFQCRARFDMFGPHDTDGMTDEVVAAFDHHRKQHHFFLAHMVVKFARERHQEMGETFGHIGTLAVYGFDALGQTDQFRQFAAMDFVVVCQDVGDQGRGFARCVGRDGRQCRKFAGNGIGVEALGRCRFGQTGRAAATEIKLVFAENAGGAGNRGGELA